MKRLWRLRTPARAASIGALALLALFLSRGAPVVEATSFIPSVSVTLSDLSPAANADVQTNFFVPALSSFPGTVIQFTPATWSVASDGAVPDGADVGFLSSTATIGFFNGPCQNPTPVNFVMMDAKADPSAPNPVPGSPGDPAWEGFQDTDLDGLPEAVDRWTSYLDVIIGDLGGVPIARYYGQTEVGGSPISLAFLVFAPGGLTGYSASLGYGAASVLVDPGAPLQPSFVTDACAPLNVISTVRGLSVDNGATPANEAGFAVRTNPPGTGLHNFTSFSVSARDAEPPCHNSPSVGVECDGDGIETGMDTCPTVPNQGDPRVAGSGDDDFDGIDNACDPTPAENTNFGDHDADGFLNRQDNCPTVPNGGTAQNELAELANPNPPPPPASRTDGIGDQCDPNPGIPDGHFHVSQIVAPITIGPHDIALIRFRGAEKMTGGQTKTYTAVVRNNALITEEIQVAIGARPIPGGGCGLPSIPGGVPVDTNGDTVPDWTVLFTSVSVNPNHSVSVGASVSFPVCTPDIGTASDYIVAADACHEGDPAPNGFLFTPSAPCPGTNDGVNDPDPGNDNFRQKEVNDTKR